MTIIEYFNSLSNPNGGMLSPFSDITKCTWYKEYKSQIEQIQNSEVYIQAQKTQNQFKELSQRFGLQNIDVLPSIGSIGALKAAGFNNFGMGLPFHFVEVENGCSIGLTSKFLQNIPRVGDFMQFDDDGINGVYEVLCIDHHIPKDNDSFDIAGDIHVKKVGDDIHQVLKSKELI